MSSRSRRTFIATIATVVSAIALGAAGTASANSNYPPVGAKMTCKVTPHSQTYVFQNWKLVGGSVSVTCNVTNVSGATLFGGTVSNPETGAYGTFPALANKATASIGIGFTYVHGTTYHFTLTSPGINSVTVAIRL